MIGADTPLPRDDDAPPPVPANDDDVRMVGGGRQSETPLSRTEGA